MLLSDHQSFPQATVNLICKLATSKYVLLQIMALLYIRFWSLIQNIRLRFKLIHVHTIKSLEDRASYSTIACTNEYCKVMSCLILVLAKIYCMHLEDLSTEPLKKTHQ